MTIKQLIMIIISCGLVACASPSIQGESDTDAAVSGRGDCIHKRSIRGYTVLDEQNLIVEASGRRNYHMVLRRRAHGLRNSLGIVFDTSTGRVCAGFDGIRYEEGMGFGDRMSDGLDAIRIASIRELTEEENDDLLIQFGKKEPEIKHTPSPEEVKGADVEELDEAASE